MKPSHERPALGEFLIGSANTTIDSEIEAAWDREIQDRIRAIDEGREVGIAYEVVMQEVEKRLTRQSLVSSR